MKIINAESSVKLTLKFTWSDIMRLTRICSTLEEVMEFCAHDGSGLITMEEIEIAGEGLELLCEIVKNAEEIR